MLCPTVPATWLCCPPQVEPPVTAAQGGQGASLLWWAQDVKPTDTLWTVAKEATTNVKSENGAKGGLAFWSRMYADKTMFEAMGQETPSFNPPFTASFPSAQGLAVLKSQRFACPEFNRQSLLATLQNMRCCRFMWLNYQLLLGSVSAACNWMDGR